MSIKHVSTFLDLVMRDQRWKNVGTKSDGWDWGWDRGAAVVGIMTFKAPITM
jgi:hypothetical protein